MAVRKVAVTVCDSCGKDRDCSRWTITGAGRTVRLDLCQECAMPARRLLTLEQRYDLFTPVTDEEIEKARQRRRDLET